MDTGTNEMKTGRCVVATMVMVIIGITFIVGPACSQGVMPVQVPLKESASDNFIYIYEQSLEKRMPDLVKCCEDAHRILSPVFNWTPKDKTIVMYSDAQDIHNGWATVYPRPMMLIYASDAPPGSTIYEPGSYIRRTVFHEYAHVLFMDAQYGADAVLSTIFGRSIALQGDPLSFVLLLLAAPPGFLSPDWYKEGLGTWAETEFVGPGRGRSSRIDMMMRMAVADNRILFGKEWFPDLPEWPYGNVTYLYGLKAMEYIHDVYSFQGTGENTPGAVADAVARSFMFSFDNQAKPVTGKTFTQLANQAVFAEITRQKKRIEQLKTYTVTNTARLTPERLTVTKPKFGPDGRFIYFSGREEADRNTLFHYDIETKRLTKLTSARTTIDLFTDLSPAPDRKTMYYTRLNIQGRDRLRNEFYALDTQNKSSRLIAKDGRYRYPAVSPDGNHMAAVVNRDGTQSLITVPLSHAGDPEHERILTEAPQGYSLIDPAYTPGGDYIIYIRASDEESQIKRLSVSAGNENTLLTWPCIILSPIFHPTDGTLIFVSDRNGVYNLYRMTVSGQAKPEALTNVLGGIFNPDVSPDGNWLTATGYDSHGYYLTILDYPAMKPADGHLPTIDDDWKSLPSNLMTKQKIERISPPRTVLSDDYISFANIRFDGWAPWLTASEDGVMGGLYASWSDPTLFQQLRVSAGLESHYKTPVGSIVYRYAGMYPIVTVYGITNPEYYDNLIQDDTNTYYDYDEEVRTAGVAVTLPLPRVDWESNLTLGYQVTDRSTINESTEDYRGKTLRTTNIFEGTESSLWTQVDFFNAAAFGRSHSMEDGRFVRASADWTDDSIGSEINRTRARLDWNEYIKIPWLENHVLKLNGVFATGRGDETAQGFFGLGGYSVDINSVPGLNRTVVLRGYGSNYQVGKEVMKGSIAYRFPIYRHYKNINTTSPFYLHQVFGEVFFEGGKARGGTPDRDYDWLKAAGLEVNISTTLFRLLPVSPGIGIAYAFDRDERNDDNNDWQFYLSIKTVVSF